MFILLPFFYKEYILDVALFQTMKVLNFIYLLNKTFILYFVAGKEVHR